MKFTNIKQKIKDGISSSADKMLSEKVKDELGFNKPTIDSLMTLSESPDIDANLNSFYKPVNSTFLSGRDYKNIQKWTILGILIVGGILLFLFTSILIPGENYTNSLEDSQIIIDGNELKRQETPEEIDAKVNEPDAKEIAKSPSEELKVENITVRGGSEKALAKNSPLLKSNDVTIVEYKIRSGDTLELIAQRFYGNSRPSTVEKIKVANKIRNVRLLQIGQKIMIPM